MPVHMESAVGTFRALQEDHLPVDVITEQDVDEGTRLNLYKVLILPDAACLSDSMNEKIRDFVKNGGGLLAMHQSSLSDEYGTPRKDFGLADLFSAHYDGAENHTVTWPIYDKATRVGLIPHAITKDPVLDRQYRQPSDHCLDYIGHTSVVKAAEGADVVAFFGTDGVRTKLANAESKPAGLNPLLVVSDHGKGKVAYFAADIGQSYFAAPYAYERRLITNALVGPRAKAAAVGVTPMGVAATFYEQPKENRLVVHLLNEINSTGGKALPDANPPMREEVVPIHGITVRFSNAKIKAPVTLEPEHQDLDIKQVDGGVEVAGTGVEVALDGRGFGVDWSAIRPGESVSWVAGVRLRHLVLGSSLLRFHKRSPVVIAPQGVRGTRIDRKRDST